MTRGLTLAVALLVLLAPVVARAADPVRPRFVLLIDTSGSMTENAGRVRTHGDGSVTHPGCDLDGNGKFDDSKLYQAKSALQDVMTAFGSVEFSLARYKQTEFGQVCTALSECTAISRDANICEAGRCAYHLAANTTDYNECVGGTATRDGCIRCAAPDNDPTHVYYNGNGCCTAGEPRSNGLGMAGDVLVGFPGSGGSNLQELLMWIDGKEDFPAGSNKELRATGTTPIGGSMNAVRDWLVNDASTIGPGAGIINRDPLSGCRSYNVILVTDGIEVGNCVQACGLNGPLAAESLFHACTNNGQWDSVDGRCELGGNPAGTREVRVKTYVVGYNVNDPSLNAIAAAGGTGTALLADNGAELTARLGDIVSQSVATERCNCKDDTCDGEIDESFPGKGKSCSVGTGRCKRGGTLGCKPDGAGLLCASTPSGMCPASELVEDRGAAVAEVCGAAPGCEAPGAEDCADDDCDGLVDENMSCMCAAKPEVCNGADDDCNGKIDDVAAVPCGLAIGDCRPGVTSCREDGQGGRTTACMGGTAPGAELCDGRDNDCDGVVDGFGLACYPAGTPGCELQGAAQSCEAAPATGWKCAGACQTGLLTCAEGRCGACGGAVTPSTEVACDAVDNDCDGEVDEGFGLGGPCGGAGPMGMMTIGECRPGVLGCDGFNLRCVGATAPGDETCNGRDDDCNGQVDDLPGQCGVIRGECRPGRFRCSGAQPVCEPARGPEPELCNGKDDDCDGAVDEEPTDADLRTLTMCGSAVGICRPGVLRCAGGGKFCDGAVAAEPERCNGLDDNCDGTADNGINPPGPCPPPGLPAGSPVVGECRPGANSCVAMPAGGAGWQCQGGVGPVAEQCNGRDDDCDGTADDGATCPMGQGCSEGECVPRCAVSEFPCPADRVCKDGLCVWSECVRRACPAGTRCDPRQGCVDPCAGVACPDGTVCSDGVCTSCFLTGCPAGQLCRGAACEPDTCAGIRCPAGGYCRAGACVNTCDGVRCPSGQACHAGACAPDRCAAVRCPAAQACDPGSGRCGADPCGVIQCVRGQVCVPAMAACLPDPCAVTTCAAKDTCVVDARGQAECVDRRTLAARQSVRLKAEGSGCGCRVGAAPGPGVGAVAPFLVVALFLVRRRRGRA